MKRNDNFSFLSLSLFHPILTWNEATIVFLNFLNFFSYFFFALSVMRRVGTKRNDNFYFLSLSAFYNLFWLEKKPHQCFSIFFFKFFAIFFGIFYYALGGNETELKFLFSLFLGLFQPILAWNEATMVFFYFFYFSSRFLEFCITRPVGKEQKDNFYLWAFSNQFWLEITP